MFGIGTSELVVIAIIVFLIYGPDKLPEMVRRAGKFYKDVRQASDDVTGVIRREVRNFEILTRYPNENAETPPAALPAETPPAEDVPPAPAKKEGDA